MRVSKPNVCGSSTNCEWFRGPGTYLVQEYFSSKALKNVDLFRSFNWADCNVSTHTSFYAVVWLVEGMERNHKLKPRYGGPQ